MPAPVSALNASTRTGETLEQRYLRQTRNATVFIAVIVGIVTVIVPVGVIWTATTVSELSLAGDDRQTPAHGLARPLATREPALRLARRPGTDDSDRPVR